MWSRPSLGISLLYVIHASWDIRYCICTSGNGGNLELVDHPGAEDYSHQSHLAAGPQNSVIHRAFNDLYPVWRPPFWFLWMWLEISWDSRHQKMCMCFSTEQVEKTWKNTHLHVPKTCRVCSEPHLGQQCFRKKLGQRRVIMHRFVKGNALQAWKIDSYTSLHQPHCNNSYIDITLTSDSMFNSLVVLLDPENMSICVGLSLLSCLQAEINVISCLLPVTSRHLWFTTYPDVGQYVQ